MNSKLSELKAAFEAEEKTLKEQMVKVKSALLEYCKDQNVESVPKTTHQNCWRNASTKATPSSFWNPTPTCFPPA